MYPAIGGPLCQWAACAEIRAAAEIRFSPPGFSSCGYGKERTTIGELEKGVDTIKRLDEILIMAVVVIFGAWVVQSGIKNISRPDFSPFSSPVKQTTEQAKEKPAPKVKMAIFNDNGIVCREQSTLRNVAGAIKQNDLHALYRMEQEGKIFFVKAGTVVEVSPYSKTNTTGVESIYIIDGAYTGESGYTISAFLKIVD